MYRVSLSKLFLRLSTTLTFLSAASGQDVPIIVPPGFQVQHYADDDLAHDIHSLTIDARGRVVVSGPGYVRILIDRENDGKADDYLSFADAPIAGAQGLHFMGPHLLCSGDDGLQIFRDENDDGKADGAAETFLKIRTGAEHHAHAIQRGPDGWWYIIAGNKSGIDGSYANLPSSPIKNPEAGVLMRLKPDLSGGEIVSDGLRNAYDFAFSEVGDVFTADSDGERDVSLPWYVPCRALQLAPGTHAGWVSRCWKRPGDFPDTAPVLAEFGRGSPTGMLCYRHEQFASRYMGAIFALDWSFGRIMVMSLEPHNGQWKANSTVFAKARGHFGFAPTDMAVAPDGSMYVSVGGRGTRGSVYRIFHTAGARRTPATPEIGDTRDQQLSYVLNAPQPGSSWSRASWYPLAQKLGQEAFASAAIDEGRRSSERVRAIEILTDAFDGLSVDTARTLSAATAATVRARAAWSVGRFPSKTATHGDALVTLLKDRNPFVVRNALEALGAVNDLDLVNRSLPQLALNLGSESTAVRFAASVVVPGLQDNQSRRLQAMLEGGLRSQVWMALGQAARKRCFHPGALRLALRALQNVEADFDEKAEALRLMQLSIGDVGPQKNVVGMFEAYTAAVPLAEHQAALDPVRVELRTQLPTGNQSYDRELIRTIAMLGAADEMLAGKLLACITADSSPTDDLHCLAALARDTSPRLPQQTQDTAQALVDLELKIHRLGMKQDSNWDDRIAELYAALCEIDLQLPELIGQQEGFGQPGHVLFLKSISSEKIQTAIDCFAGSVQADANYQWSNDVVFVIGRSGRQVHKQLIRNQLANPGVRDAVLIVLARDAQASDRQIYLDGLNSPQRRVVEASTEALRKLPRNNDAAEQYKLFFAARRLDKSEQEFGLRERMIRLLENNSGHDFGFVYGKTGHRQQPVALNAIQAYLKQRYPDFTAPAAGGVSADKLLAALSEIEWETGDSSRGEILFARLSCARCHGGRTALGPDLHGVGKRFSTGDLFAAIVDPDRDIANKYQMTTVRTKSGKVYSGLIAYESVDGVVLRDSDHKMYRVEAEDIESRTLRRRSLMPSGLLRGATYQQLADLYAYLQGL